MWSGFSAELRELTGIDNGYDVPAVNDALLLAAGLFVRKHPILIGLGLGGLLHVALDTTLGQIAWAWPFSDTSSPLIVVQPTHSHWLGSFMAHWTFQIEIALWGIAGLCAWRVHR